MTGRAWDAVVVGAGPGGGAAALRLARAGWAVAVVEKKPFPRRKVCGEYVSGTNLPLFADLGLADAFGAAAGPPVTRAGLFAGETVLTADLPRPAGGWGRAVSRDRLDALVLDRARAAGARVFQPYAATGLRRAGDRYVVTAEPPAGGGPVDLTAPVVVAAHGSWEPGPLPTQPARRPAGPGDLLALKAHFRGSALPADLMPLLAFPGGYGGMAPLDGGRVSLSLVVRRAALDKMRAATPGPAGPAVLAFLLRTNRGVRDALAGAALDGSWLGAGPIRPGVRVEAWDGLFRVGNAAGEANPTVAEGISMALQAGALAAAHLVGWKAAGGRPADLPRVGREYAAGWRAAFGPRVRVAGVLARWCMSPAAVAVTLPAVRRWPGLVSRVAALTGKADHRYLDLSPGALVPA